MSQTLKKRCREALPDYNDVQEPKRFHCEEADQFLHLLQLDQTLADEEEECALSEELVNEVMRSLEEEIAATCSSSFPSSSSGEDSSASDISRSHEDQILDLDIDLCYLLEASDDELGIPPSPVLILKDELCISPKETSEGLSNHATLKSLGENWHFEDDFENYQQFALYENLLDTFLLEDYMSRDQNMLSDGDFSTTWELETSSGM